jgi:membrane protease YdiL (CAAX protease family)
MTGETQKARGWTAIGLAIALLGLPAITMGWRFVVPDPNALGPIVLREVAILALVGLLLWLVVAREKQPLSSIGLADKKLWRSLLWGLACTGLMVIGIGVAFGMIRLLDLHQLPSGAQISPSLWVTTLIVIRAGIAEEVFYRGYAMMRIEALTGKSWIAALVPLALFAGFHYRLGAPGMIIALVLGAVLTGFFLWKRNLVANMFAHFLVDFVPNVLLPLLGAGD